MSNYMECRVAVSQRIPRSQASFKGGVGGGNGCGKECSGTEGTCAGASPPQTAQRTCQVAELWDKHGRTWQDAARTSPPLRLTDQNRLLQVSDFLVILLFKGRKISLFTANAFSNMLMDKKVSLFKTKHIC